MRVSVLCPRGQGEGQSIVYKSQSRGQSTLSSGQGEGQSMCIIVRVRDRVTRQITQGRPAKIRKPHDSRATTTDHSIYGPWCYTKRRAESEVNLLNLHHSLASRRNNYSDAPRLTFIQYHQPWMPVVSGSLDSGLGLASASVMTRRATNTTTTTALRPFQLLAGIAAIVLTGIRLYLLPSSVLDLGSLILSHGSTSVWSRF